MHSSNLRSTDFAIFQNGIASDHAQFFQDHSNLRRLGLLAPNGYEGVAAINLIMAYITAFYDTYRAASGKFYAYPDYFSFQSCTPLASYTMFDIWPEHKSVHVSEDAPTRLNAINDRAINILILPDKEPTEQTYHPAQLESARRTIDRCYVYSFSGQVRDADLTIESQNSSLLEWAGSVFATAVLAQTPLFQQKKSEWEVQLAQTSSLTQSFRTITLAEALTLL